VFSMQMSSNTCRNSLRSQVFSQSFILDEQFTNDALKRLNASLKIGFFQEYRVSQSGISGHCRRV
jgi:hypothetical protein